MSADAIRENWGCPVDQPHDATTALGVATGLGLSGPDAEVLAASMTWWKFRAGDYLFRCGDDADALFVIASGRLRVLPPSGGSKELSSGAVFGEAGLLLGGVRSADVAAVRDTVVGRLGQAEFERAVERVPTLGLALARTVSRYLQAGTGAPVAASTVVVAAGSLARETRDDPVTALARSLLREHTNGSVIHISPSEVAEADASRVGRRRRPGCGGRSSRRSGRTRTAGPFVALFRRSPTREPGRVGPGPSGVSGASDRHRVLARTRTLRPSSSCATGQSTRHRAGGPTDQPHRNRSRARRRGPRGLAHIGVLQAIEEFGVAVDDLGGSSMGAIMGALAAQGTDAGTMLEITARSLHHGRLQRDVAAPTVSVLRGRTLHRLFVETFGDRRIEDLWTGFFCTTVNLTRGELQIHTTGPIGCFALASGSVPGLFPPVVDDRGELHSDGGQLNNLPADVMRASAGGTVVAVDVSLRGNPVRFDSGRQTPRRGGCAHRRPAGSAETSRSG